jgi:hypothetical protein
MPGEMHKTTLDVRREVMSATWNDAKHTLLVGARLAVGALGYCLAYSARRPKVLGLAVLVDE